MIHQLQLQLLLFLLLLLPTTYSKSVIEPCSSSDSCISLLSYLLPWDLKLSEIASRFQINISDILAANSIDPTTTLPSIGNQILQAKSLLKVPIPCPCADGIRRSMATTYAVQAADTVDSISEGYGGLVGAEQIRSVNGINGKKALTSGESVVIPLPCTCFNNSNNGVPTVYLSYVVQRGESLSSIGGEYGTTVMDLVVVNGLGQPVVDPGDILAVPIPACSSANLDWYNETLIVPNASYALTANNCIKCTCGPTDLNLQCFPSGMVRSCSHLQCNGSDLFIGDIYQTKTLTGCDVSACVYRGHNGRRIFRSLVNSSQAQCSGNRSLISTPPPSPTSSNPLVPILTLSPSPSPSQSPSSNQPTGIDPSNATNAHNSSISSDGKLLRQGSCFSFSFSLLMLVELVISFFI